MLAGFATVLCQTCASCGDEVFDNIRWLEVVFENVPDGKHTLSLVMIDPEIVVERIVVNPDYNICSSFGPCRNFRLNMGHISDIPRSGNAAAEGKMYNIGKQTPKKGYVHES